MHRTCASLTQRDTRAHSVTLCLRHMLSMPWCNSMLSYQWSSQAIVQRLDTSLLSRGYLTWFDLSNMKGSTMDAMSDAIEGADVMLYGVSLAYKESANCRLEASWDTCMSSRLLCLVN